MKYWNLFTLCLQLKLTYKVRITIWIINDTINFAVFPFIWLAIFGNNSMINGFSRADIVSYYIIMALISLAFSAHISNSIRPDIIEGGLNSILVRPINYIMYQIIVEWSYRLVTIILAIPLIIMLYIFVPQYLLLPFSVVYLLFFVISLLLSLALSFLIQFVIGLAVFWFGETGAMDGVRHILNNVFSGKLAPLVFYPLFLQKTADILPFKYMYYFPFQIYSGRVSYLEIGQGFGITIFWILFFSLVVYMLWRRGLKNYDGAGM